MSFRTILTAILLFLAAGALASQQPQHPGMPPPPPRDPEVIDAQGYTRLLEQYRGKALLVNFWATWCEPCRDEYPLLNDLAKEYGPKGLNIVGVDLDGDGEMILMRRFLARYKPVFPNYRKKEGGQAAFIQSVLPGWNGAIPASFFYAKDGRQLGHLLGENKRDTYEAAIHTLLSNSGGN